MNHGSLFSGIGGFDLAAEWMGWENIFHCEINPFCQKVLKYHFPKSISYADIKKTDFTIHRGAIDILTGGFPCQDLSVASSNGRNGLAGEKSGLWREMLRAIRSISPQWIVCENVYGLLTQSGGLAIEEVLNNLEAENYEVWTAVLPALSIGANHIRKRIWIVAHSTGERNRLQKKEVQAGRNIPKHSHWWHTESPIPKLYDGFPPGLDGKAFPNWRVSTSMAFGNAIVHSLALQIFKAIQQMENI